MKGTNDMRKIEIYEWKDFEQLENLEGSDYIFVKVHTESLPKKMAAISLKNFFGTLDLCLEPTLKRKVNVIDSSFSQAFFKDIVPFFNRFWKREFVMSISNLFGKD